jgi:superfamily I DNA/RNA helicase
MHRVKGLAFDHVIITGVNDGTVPFTGAGGTSSDPVVRREAEVQERALLNVAATRANKEVVVTSHGTPSRFLKSTF